MQRLSAPVLFFFALSAMGGASCEPTTAAPRKEAGTAESDAAKDESGVARAPKAKKKGPSKVLLIKRMGRFHQTNQWSKLEKVAQTAYRSDDPELKSLGSWYLTLIAANNGAPKEELLKGLEETIRLGYKNPDAIEIAEQLVQLRDLREFRQLVADLRKVVEKDARDKFRRSLDAEIAHSRKLAGSHTEADPLGLGQLTSFSGEPFWKAGKPTLLVITRIHHDGFLKLFHALRQRYEERGHFAASGVLYFQVNAADPGRLRQTRDEYDRLAGSGDQAWPTAVTGLAHQDKIEDVLRERKNDPGTDPFYFPVTVLLDATGAPLLSRKGSLLGWQLDLLLDRFENVVAVIEAEAEAEVAKVKKAEAEAKKAEAEAKKAEAEAEKAEAEAEKAETEKAEAEKTEAEAEKAEAEAEKAEAEKAEAEAEKTEAEADKEDSEKRDF